MKRLFVSKSSRKAISEIGLHGQVLAKSESLGAHELSLLLRLNEIAGSENEQ